jgi:hypothetical protein
MLITRDLCAKNITEISRFYHSLNLDFPFVKHFSPFHCLIVKKIAQKR